MMNNNADGNVTLGYAMLAISHIFNYCISYSCPGSQSDLDVEVPCFMD